MVAIVRYMGRSGWNEPSPGGRTGGTSTGAKRHVVDPPILESGILRRLGCRKTCGGCVLKFLDVGIHDTQGSTPLCGMIDFSEPQRGLDRTVEGWPNSPVRYQHHCLRYPDRPGEPLTRPTVVRKLLEHVPQMIESRGICCTLQC